MGRSKWAVLFVLFGISLGQECNNDKVVACYYASWANYRTDEGRFNISNINPKLCTHLIYTFAGLDINSHITSLDANLDINQGFYTAFNDLKTKNPCLKTLLAIGGWKEGSRKYSVMTSTEESQNAFVEGALRFVVNYGFDGLDFDWEYPAHRGGIPEDKSKFVSLLSKLKTRFSPWNLMLTVAVPMSSEVTTLAYEVEEVGKIVDYVFLMAYDFTDTSSKTTGLLAPIDELDKTVNIWLEKMNKTKLVLGIPTYARTFNLKDMDDNGLGAPTNGLGMAGEFTKEAGFLSYYELQAELLSGIYEIVKVDGKENYYAYSTEGTDWFTFDAADTYAAKAHYVLENDLAGVMIWTIDTDDFNGIFNETTYPVLSLMKEILLGTTEEQ